MEHPENPEEQPENLSPETSPEEFEKQYKAAEERFLNPEAKLTKEGEEAGPENAPEPPVETTPVPPVNPEIQKIADFRLQLHNEIGRVIVGQKGLMDQLIITVLCDGHALLEGVPGVAKTLISKTLATLMGVDFRRIQFTPDLMPADIIGTKVFDFSDSSFKIQQGPIFSNLVLIDEVNRAPAKTQSALLEVMEERQVTIEGETFLLDPPFMVLATQNPVEFEGTYSLPEAQMDRFLMKILVDYPSAEEEQEILRRYHEGVLGVGRNRGAGDDLKPILNKEKIAELRAGVRSVRVEEGILGYINKLVRATRNHPYLYLGSSPRGNISLLLASKAHAAIEGRDYVNPDDVKQMAPAVLRHRVNLSPEAEIEGLTTDQILRELADQTEVPR